MKDGKERWRWEHQVPGRISHPGSRTVPTVTDEAVYGSSGFGHVYCIDRKTGKKQWVVDVAKTFDSQPPRFGYAVHPLIHGGHCIIAPTGDSVGLAALDKKTGKTMWTTERIGDSHSSPIIVKLLGREILVMPGSSR
ncbi:MAG: PQQ-binding-like beta-propeller repeat protein, partial [Akkermansiaceae bacterium]|nr:PQQ-binding-like beta-propeller repeat protein [Akkermansiaceae bacterium]